MSQTHGGRIDEPSTGSRRRLSSGYGSSSPPARARSPRFSPSSSSHRKRQRSRDRRHDRRSSKERSGKDSRVRRHRRHRSRSSSLDLRYRLDSSRRRRRSRSSSSRRQDKEKRIIHGSGQVQFVNKKWAALLCSRKDRLVIFHRDDYPQCFVGDRVRYDASYVHRDDRPSCHADIRYHAFKIEKKQVETDSISNKSPSRREKEGKANDPNFVLDTAPVLVDNQKESLRTVVIENDRRMLVRAVLDNTATRMVIPRPRMSSAYRERRSKRFEPTIALKNRKGIIRMEGKWPIILDQTDGRRVSLFPERFGNGRVAPRDGMFVRYNAHLSAWAKLRCRYNALSAEEISQEEYNNLELFSKSSASAQPRPLYRRISTSFVSRNEGEIVPGLEGVQGAPRVQLPKDYRLARAFREINKMRPDRQAINHECSSLFERGGVWDRFKTVVVVDNSCENDRLSVASSPLPATQEEVEDVDADAEDPVEDLAVDPAEDLAEDLAVDPAKECDQDSPAPETDSNAADEDIDDAAKSTDDADDSSSIIDEVDDVGFMVYDDEEQRLELEAYERQLKEKKAMKMLRNIADEPMDID